MKLTIEIYRLPKLLQEARLHWDSENGTKPKNWPTPAQVRKETRRIHEGTAVSIFRITAKWKDQFAELEVHARNKAEAVRQMKQFLPDIFKAFYP